MKIQFDSIEEAQKVRDNINEVLTSLICKEPVTDMAVLTLSQIYKQAAAASDAKV